MKITFTENVKYCEDGFAVKQGCIGVTREVTHSAACDLLNRGKAYNAEQETGSKSVDEVINNLHSVISGIDKWHEQLHAQMDALNKLLRPADEALLPLPNKALRGSYMPGMSAVLKSEESAA